MSSERRIQGWSHRNPLPLGAWGLLSTTTEFLSTAMDFLSTMKELYDTMMESQCNTKYNGTAFDGFLECGSRFTLILNTAKSTNYIEKYYRQKYSILNFLQKKKKQWTHIFINQVVEPEGSKDSHSHSSALCLPAWESQRYAVTEFLVRNLIILINFCSKQFLI